MTGRLNLVVLGLSLSSAWGNGHATTWRSLLRALAAQGHSVLFLEQDVPWFAAHRDLPKPPYCELALYQNLAGLRHWRQRIAAADAVLVGSYVPHGIAVGDFVQQVATGPVLFYDIDTPVTLGLLARGACEYISADQIPRYATYLSFSGGPVLDELRKRYRAPAAVPLYCSVDEAVHRPQPHVVPRWDLSNLGTYSADRQPMLDRLLIEPARRAPQRRFMVAGAQFPDSIDWPANVARLHHVPPAEHPRFYAESRFTLNVTRADMVDAGWSPSVRLFEAAACGTPVISDTWQGLDTLFVPGQEILLPQTPDDVLDILQSCDQPRRRMIAAQSRARVLAAHTARHRAIELEAHLRGAMQRRARRRNVAGMVVAA